VVRDAGLVCSMGYPTDRKDFLSTGFNDRANHAMLLRELERTIPLAAQHAVPNVIAMFGNRAGKSDSAGIAASIEGLSKIKPLAEQHGVTVCVELLNSKVDHKDYQGDHTAFGVEVMKGVGSPRVKLLYDIYHMQIMEGDVIRTIREHHAHIGTSTRAASRVATSWTREAGAQLARNRERDRRYELRASSRTNSSRRLPTL
jgi:hydroxypyruvate isomerase